ncbi:unnamed protein product [Prunus armeniaca]
MLNPNCPNCGEPYASVALMGICAFASLPVETCCIVKLPIFGMTQYLAVVVARFFWSYAHIKLVIARYLSTTHSTCNVK